MFRNELLIALSCALAYSSGVVFCQSATANATTRVTGVVTCEDTRYPARGAIVSLSPIPLVDGLPRGEGQQSRVHEDGTYTFEHVPAGDYLLTVLLAGYLSNSEQDFEPEHGTYAPEGEVSRDLLSVPNSGSVRHDVSLQRGGVLSGTVVYADGIPAVDLPLALSRSLPKPDLTNEQRMQQNIRENVLNMIARRRMFTDDRGQFRIISLKPGTYRLYVLEPVLSVDSRGAGAEIVPDMEGEITPSLNATRFYAGDTVLPLKATKFNVDLNGDIHDIKITIPTNLFHQVGGQLLSSDGHVINGAIVELTDSNESGLHFEASVQGDGTFHFVQVPSGSYSLRVSRSSISEVVGDPNGKVSRAHYLRAFADTRVAVTVKTSDLTDQRIVLQEVALPADLLSINKVNSF